MDYCDVLTWLWTRWKPPITVKSIFSLDSLHEVVPHLVGVNICRMRVWRGEQHLTVPVKFICFLLCEHVVIGYDYIIITASVLPPIIVIVLRRLLVLFVVSPPI